MKEYKPYIVIFILASILMFFIGCTKTTSDDGGLFMTPPPRPAFQAPAWDHTSCYGINIKVEGPIEVYSHGVYTMARFGGVTPLMEEIGGKHVAGRIPTGNQLGDDPEGAGYANQLEVDGYIIAMYHPTPTYPDNFIVYRPATQQWWRYDLGFDEEHCNVRLTQQSD